ncbi:hypothetical protein L3Q82_026163 [Scortum barcoo]|uniref:Uncharacterized protein n=1 Tax=Scortum barcoo TaxID=214431 RepID=A0ACB8WI14_9TELE|nr:hypothetical protein L3Q82_026163 [Scortum barcoo]
MIRLLIHLAALPLCLTEVSKNSAHQTPARLIKHPGEEALINCSHSNTDFDMIQWYKQSPGKNDMTLIGYVRYTSIVVEDKFKDAYNVTGDGSSLSGLQMLKLSRSEHSAVYFCAASKARCCTNPPPSAKTSPDAASYTTTQNCHMNDL